MNEDPKSAEKVAAAADSNESKNEEADQASLSNGNPTAVDVDDITTSGMTPEETVALGGKQVPVDAVHGDNTNAAQTALMDGVESQPLSGDSTSLDVKVTNSGETDVPEASEKPEQEQVPDEEDDDEVSNPSLDFPQEPGADDVQGSARPRYELSYWHHHLRSAEKLWTAEEREKSDQWKELWKLVIQFLCESPDAFKVWQQCHMDLGYEYEVYDTLLSPLQLAAAYGMPGLVKILLDRGELAAAETVDGRSALWFGAVSPDIEIIRLLLGNGASPNAYKDFLTPFNNLLRWNPELEFVNLMLEHGAQCDIIDAWSTNAMHWFALAGSDIEILKALLKAHGDINVPDGIGETPLHLAMYKGQDLSLDLLRVFLESGADVNKDDNDSQSKSSKNTSSLQCIDTSRAIVRDLPRWKCRGSQDVA